jgi:hypothetical protein
MDARTGTLERGSAIAAAETLWLMGQPSLDELLGFVEEQVVEEDPVARRELTTAWRSANDLYHELERDEAGAAERVRVRALPRALALRARALEADPRHRGTFEAVPTRIAMVELDRLIVSRNDIIVEPHFLLPDDLFGFCLPLEPPPPALRIVRIDGSRFLFACSGEELQAGDAAILDGAAMAALPGESAAALSGVVLPVVHPSPLMSAIHSDKRLVLTNGHKRALTLRSAGVAFAPCLIHEVTRTDELALVARESVVQQPEFYFRSKRPPLLRDFLDPRLVRRFATRPRETIVEVELKVRAGPAIDCAGSLT